MRWEDGKESENVEDRRNTRVQGAAIGGIGMLVLMVIVYFLGGDPKKVADVVNRNAGGGQVVEEKGPVDKTPEEARQAKFVRVVLGMTEQFWNKEFAKLGKQYPEPKLILFREGAQSGCGFADTAVGPFYCPADQHVYIDLSFFGTLEKDLRAPGEFARAYVIAHEVGHHVQRTLGTSARVDEARGTAKENEMSVRLELQADFYAGMFGNWAERNKVLEPGDLESALKAAFQIGDDTLQKTRGTGRVTPENFTHGTSEQRMRWFKRGFQTGSMKEAAQAFELPYNQL